LHIMLVRVVCAQIPPPSFSGAARVV
jgi:hypothetical protein